MVGFSAKLYMKLYLQDEISSEWNYSALIINVNKGKKYLYVSIFFACKFFLQYCGFGYELITNPDY